MARRRFLQEHAEEELKSLSSLGPMSGFFTYGEFFHLKSRNKLLNETMTILLLSEEKEPLDFSFDAIDRDALEHKIRANHVIARLANTVSNELEELNKNLEKRVQENAEFILKQAYYDKLTGLPNRLNLISRLENAFGETVFLVNIDDFTTINDFYGYEVGDRVILKLAEILVNFVKPLDGEVYRLPSDEFAIILHTAHHTQEIESLMKQLISTVSKEEFEVDGNVVHVSVTMAAAYLNEKKTGLANADMTLKMAKKSGKPYMIFNEDLQLTKQYEENIKMAAVIKRAIKNDKIIPYYQPIFSVETGEIEKYEALVRLIKEDGSLLSPFFFLNVSEKIKLYPTITEIMIEKTFSFFKENGLNFSINLAFSDILNEKTNEFLFSKIVEYGIAPQLTIEILETQEFEKNDTISRFINDVYAYGAKIAIDDFGSGFANFKYMTTIESDYMKIDGSLVRDIVSNENDRLVVETIISFAKKLGKKTIAEFVHSKEVYDMVKEMGVDYAQGFYLAEPSATIVQE
jgi:diguanylate cyclase (GGDEF)-like protein